MPVTPPPRREPWRVLLTPRWIFGHLLALTLVTVFIICGFWQVSRLAEVREENAVQLAQSQLEPLHIGDGPLLPALNDAAAGATELDLRRAEATGVFEPELELLLRSRSWNGQPGWHVLTPLRLQDGQRLLVNRGWVPYEHDTVPVGAATPPAGPVTVSGILQATQVPPSGFAAAFAPQERDDEQLDAVWYVDLERFRAGQIPGLLPGAWLLLQELEPEQAGELPRLVQPPAVGDEGPHLGYAIQWFSFAAIGIIGYWFLMRRVLRDAAAVPAGQKPAA